MMTVLLQGLTAGWVASLLNLRLTSQIEQECLQAANNDINTQEIGKLSRTGSKLV